MNKTTLVNHIKRPLLARQHALTLAPDFLLILGGVALLVVYVELARVMDGLGAMLLRPLCEVVGLLFVGVGLAHALCWLGLYVVVDTHEIVIRRCWLQEKRIPIFSPNVTVRLEQNNWLDVMLDKGTLIVYTPMGDVITIPNLADYSRLSQLLQ